MSLPSFFYSQLFVEPKLPDYDFSGQTVVVTGGNRGLGLETARHLLRMNASRVILAVRNLESGKEAAKDLEASTGRTGTVEVHELDMLRHESVQSFASEMEALDRIDAVILNAGIFTQDLIIADGYESSLTTNCINTFFLALLLVPILRRSATALNILPRIVIVSSDRHVMTNLPEWKQDHPFEVLSDPKKAKMDERYYESKLIQVLLTKAMAKRMTGSQEVVLNSLTPGYTHSGLCQNLHTVYYYAFKLLAKATARKTEVGARTLVSAAAGGKETHGEYMNDGVVDVTALSPFVRSEDGTKASEKLWFELLNILEQWQPNIKSILGTSS
ncbi:Short chain dehydrogenase FGM9 [Cladobotryum mycophilum]|uniref:Short chain dehydrogenase FGM9 n=1 Tax=Cladobotryum mycophilum TaxID=491253 RepID=A0ABR0SWA8_9HYPO